MALITLMTSVMVTMPVPRSPFPDLRLPDEPDSVLALQGVVVEELLDEVDVAHEHATAAVPVQIQRVQRVSLGVVRLKEVQVGVPLVPDHLRGWIER